MTPHTRWSAAEIAELRRLDRLGMSAAAIATILERERNAVCGKLFRLRRRDTAPPKPKPKPVAANAGAPPPRGGRQFWPARAPLMPAAEAGEKPVVVAPGAPPGGVALLDAGQLHCRMIIGDVHAADTRVCGCPVLPGASWCPTHYGVVFTRRAWGYGEGKA